LVLFLDGGQVCGMRPSLKHACGTLGEIADTEARDKYKNGD
jgi:hypothetical protein